MQNFSIKTINIRNCRRCGSVWCGENIDLKVKDQIQFITITIPHCPVCSEDFAAEVDRPGYRRTGKRIQ